MTSHINDTPEECVEILKYQQWYRALLAKTPEIFPGIPEHIVRSGRLATVKLSALQVRVRVRGGLTA